MKITHDLNLPTWKLDEANVIVHIVPAPCLVNGDAAVSRAIEGKVVNPINYEL